MGRTGSKPIDELIELARSGNGLAFTALWDRHIDRLRAYIRGKMNVLNEADVDDICSRSFEKAFRQIHNYDAARSQFPTWLLTIAHNTALDMMEQETRHHPRGEYFSLDDTTRAGGTADVAAEADNPLDSIIKDEDDKEKEKYIDGLPDLYREIARRRIIGRMAYKDIAEEFGLELNTVKTRIRRAKALIERSRMEDEEGLS